jgi:hypothetical protein
MEQKDKELLLKDLCARLPYNTQIQGTLYEDILDNDGEETGKVEEKTVTFNLYIIGKNSIMYNGHWIPLELCKPYLRPMSSMTRDEREEIEVFICDKYFIDDSGSVVKVDKTGFIEFLSNYDCSGIYPDFCGDFVDWLNFHHFDYRGLIKKGLALEAPEGMYDIQ